MRTNDIAAKWILEPDSIQKLKDDVEAGLQSLVAGEVGTAYNEPCVVAVSVAGKLVLTGLGNMLVQSSDLSGEPTIRKLDELTIGEAIDIRLISYVNKTVTRNQLTDILIKEIT